MKASKGLPTHLYNEIRSRNLEPLIYYLRDYDDRPVVTRCILVQPDGTPIASGTAFCSSKDNPNKAVGRTLATSRALAALREGYKAVHLGPGWQQYTALTKQDLYPTGKASARYLSVFERRLIDRWLIGQKEQ